MKFWAYVCVCVYVSRSMYIFFLTPFWQSQMCHLQVDDWFWHRAFALVLRVLDWSLLKALVTHVPTWNLLQATRSLPVIILGGHTRLPHLGYFAHPIGSQPIWNLGFSDNPFRCIHERRFPHVSVSVCIRMYVCMYVYLSVRICMFMCMCVFVYPIVCLCLYLDVCISILVYVL